MDDQKSMETGIPQSEARLWLALEAAQMGIWDWDLVTDEMVWDGRCRAIFEVPDGIRLTIDTFHQALHPDECDRIQRQIAETLRPGSDGKCDLEYRIIGLQSGAERWILSKGQAYFDAAGQPQRIIGTILDITERKHTETALRESEERLQLSLEGAGGGYWNWNVVTNEEYLSPRWLEMLGYEADELPLEYETWTQLIHPDDREWVLQRLQAHLQDSSVLYHFEHRLRTKSGEWKWIANYGRVVMRDAAGNPLRMAGVHYDISDQVLTKNRLRRSQDRLRMAVETAEIGTWDWKLNTKQVALDPRCKTLLGLPGESLVSIKTFFKTLHPDDRPRLKAAMQQALNLHSDGHFQVEYRTIDTQNGRQRWVAANGQVYFDAEVPQRIIGTVLDISERKRAEAERERTLRQERAARADAERENRIKDEFLAILSHELRTPLNPILGWTNLLQKKSLSQPMVAKALSAIERNARLQTQLIDDLLDVAKILRDKLTLNPQPVDLRWVIQAALDTVADTAATQSISLRFVTSEFDLSDVDAEEHEGNSRFTVLGDATRLQQIVWNLLSNAIKFTAAGGNVTVQLRRVNQQVQMIVTDTGRGIRSDFLPHLFESFRQEDVSITRQYGGLGLGLAIVQYLTEAHGGWISANSAGEGLGATFTVNFPSYSSGESGEVHRCSPMEADDDLSNIRMLIADDDDDCRELLKAILCQHGAEVVAVASGQEALEALNMSLPDMLIFDLGMPDMQRYHLIQQVRSHPSSAISQLPAIALTAHAREDDVKAALHHGFHCHVPKPVQIEQLLQTVISLMQLYTKAT